MADLPETSTWEPGVYQIETTDPVVGGPPDLGLGQGISNVPPQQLASRTLWLKDQITALQASAVDQADIDAAIATLIGGAPLALDTLNELAAALADDENYAASVTTTLAGKLDVGAKAADADKLDGLNSTQFLRADADDTGTNLTLLSLTVAGSQGIAWENGVNRITNNDGAGNVQFRMGHDYSDVAERFTHDGTAAYIGADIDSPTTPLKLKVATNGGAGDNQPVSWGPALEIGPTYLKWDGDRVLTDLDQNVVQVQSAVSQTQVTGTGIIPIDSTIPQSNEGTEFLTITITPTSLSNKLIIEVTPQLNTSANQLSGALFKDSELDAISMKVNTPVGSNWGLFVGMRHIMDVPTLAPITFKFRAGSPVASTVTMNNSIYGGVGTSSITVMEVQS